MQAPARLEVDGFEREVEMIERFKLLRPEAGDEELPVRGTHRDDEGTVREPAIGPLLDMNVLGRRVRAARNHAGLRAYPLDARDGFEAADRF